MSMPLSSLPKNLTNSFRDVIFYSLMVGMGESYLVAYCLAIGLDEMQSGLISVAPLLVGAILQLFAGYGIRLLNSRKRWITLCATLQGISLMLIAQIPHLHLQSKLVAPVLFGLATLYWSSALAAGPCWNVWIGKIVHREHRLHFFSARARIAQLFVLMGLVGSGLILEYFRQSSSYISCFSALFAIAGFFRMLSAYFIHAQDEGDAYREDPIRKKSPDIISRGLDLVQRPRILKMVAYLFVLNLAVHMSAPYFNPYMLKQLQLDFLQYTILISASFMARVVANDVFIYLAKSFGIKALLYAGVIGIAPLPLLWTLSDSWYYLLFLQILGGFAWGSHELGITLVLFENHTDRERSIVFTMTNLFNSTAMFTGGFIGAKILNGQGVSYSAYHTIFLISTVARLVPVAILFAMDHVPVPIRAVYNRIVSVRVGGASVVKPLLYLDEEPGDDIKS